MGKKMLHELLYTFLDPFYFFYFDLNGKTRRKPFSTNTFYSNILSLYFSFLFSPKLNFPQTYSLEIPSDKMVSYS